MRILPSKRLGQFLCAAMVVCLCGSALPGCIRSLSEPSQAQVDSWNFGEFPANYKEIVLASDKIKSANLGDITYEFQGEPVKGWDSEGLGYIYGWKGNLKSFTPNGGATTYEYIIRDGKLLRLIQVGDQRLIRLSK